MSPTTDPSTLRLALPKGRMQGEVFRLLEDAGVRVRTTARDYRPAVSLEGVEAKILKPQNVIGMLAAGARDVGFAGADWVEETGAGLVELMDTGLDPVRLVAAAPESILDDGRLPDRPLVVASEYASVAQRWIERRGLNATLLRTYGATEVFPPEDADCIVDNTATGSTLAANDLEILDEIMISSTRLYANPAALDNPARRERIETLVTLLKSVLEARSRMMIELNVPREMLDAVIEAIPCMREPTVSNLYGGDWCAVKAAVPRDRLASIIPQIKARGGVDIVVVAPAQIVP